MPNLQTFFSTERKLFLIIILTIVIPLPICGYLVSSSIQSSMEREKINKLYGIAYTLDLIFTSDYETILKSGNMIDKSRSEKITYLSEQLTPLSDSIASGFANTGIGYYSAELDAIITYSPSDKMQYAVGQSITKNHGGRLAMAYGKWRTYKGDELVWGDGIAVFYPIKRNDKIIGYIWAVELTDDIKKQLFLTQVSVIIAMLVGLFIAMFGLSYFMHNNFKMLKKLKAGMNRIESDLNYRLPVMKGVFGEISYAINEMANELATQRYMETRMIKTEQIMVLGYVTLSIAHEIKNPLMAIRGFVQLVKEYMIADEKLIKYLDIIEYETVRMDRLINNLLSQSRDKEREMKEYNLADILTTALALMESNFRQAKITVKTDIDSDLPHIICESDRFQQVLLNLLLNSIGALEKKSEKVINITLKLVDDKLVIKLRDNGEGINEVIIKNIFSPFFSTKTSGTGLGLFIVKGIIDSMNGLITVESEQWVYTEFTISIPIKSDTI